MVIPDYSISTFYGLNTAVKDLKALKPGVSPDALNWLTGRDKDHIELRRGYARLGNTDAGAGKVTGLGVSLRYDGTEVLHYSHGRKVKYYSVTSEDMVEVGTDLLPSTADGEDVWMRAYQGLAGSFAYIGSPNSSIYKIPAANPGSAVDQSVSSFRFGVFHFGQNRAFAGQRNGTTAGNNDKTGLYLSYIDKDQLSDFTQVTAENIGSSGATTYSGTLAERTGVRTVMYVAIKEAGGETLVDDRNGNLVGNQGSTGTINYATGEYSVTFNHTTAGAITADYYYETSTSAGLLDFNGGFANGQAKQLRQDDGGGNLMAIFNLSTIEYCFHLLKTWQLKTSLDDTETTNLPYRNIGIPYHRAAWQTPEGIIMADLSRPADPKFRRLQVLQGTTDTTIEPLSISDGLDLSGHAFDYCVAFRWGDYEIFCVQEKVNEVANAFNSVMYVHNVISGAWDKLNYYASCLDTFNGTLVAGDSISNNVYTLFSGYDEDGDVIENYWTSGDHNLGTQRQKTVRRMVIEGLIQPEQSLDVYLSYDGGAFSKVQTIDGNGSYVDSGIETYIGGPTIGSKVLGGGGSSVAHPFELDFQVNSDRFQTVRVKLVATNIGYVSVNELTFKDIRDKGRKISAVRTA